MKCDNSRACATLFSSPIGVMGIAWTKRGIIALHLPEKTKRETQTKLIGRTPEIVISKPGSWINDVIEQILCHLTGDLQEFSRLPLDLTGTPLFSQQVYKAAKKIKAGDLRTYGEIAKAIDKPHASRAVGRALGRNPIALIIPCHRVVAASGYLGGFSAYGGLLTKQRLLAIEGVIV